MPESVGISGFQEKKTSENDLPFEINAAIADLEPAVAGLTVTNVSAINSLSEVVELSGRLYQQTQKFQSSLVQRFLVQQLT